MSTPNLTPPSPAEIWSDGDYAEVCDRMIPRLGARLVEVAKVGPGDEVLDVACGTGNATLPAASSGAVVAALDITAELLHVAEARARTAGLDVSWVLGDAQTMPFGDASFNGVLSCVGVQFCSDQAATAAELIRVCRPGGRIALIAWTPEGFLGHVLAAVSRALGTAGKGPSPLRWGTEAGLEDLFVGRVGRTVLNRESLTMSAASPEVWVDFMARAYGPMARARTALERQGEWESLRRELCEAASKQGSRNAQGWSVPCEYLIAVIERANR